MIAPRTLFGLLQLVLALLLVAGVPQAAPDRVEEGCQILTVGILTVGPPYGLFGLPDEPPREGSLQAPSVPSGSDGDDGSQPVVATPADEHAFDRARLTAFRRTSYPIAASTHRPCAAPPTGPPLA